MSWRAGRYKKGYLGSDPDEITRHHVPPRGRRRFRPFTLEVSRSVHDAYHHAIGNPRSFEEACQIMWERFWQPPQTR